MQVSCTLHFKGSKRYIDFLKKELLSNNTWLISTVRLFLEKFNILDYNSLHFFQFAMHLKLGLSYLG